VIDPFVTPWFLAIVATVMTAMIILVPDKDGVSGWPGATRRVALAGGRCREFLVALALLPVALVICLLLPFVPDDQEE